ncbi:MAG: hypothetical protein JWP97_2538 [Labilithrix sp.]|nr:hypothetical protein [Labilithrix sp.]
MARLVTCSGWLLAVAALVACGSPPPPPAPIEEHHEAPPPPPEEPVVIDSPAPPVLPPSTASYDEALATPEPLDVRDDHAHLSDGQLTGPIRGVLAGCKVPGNAKVTIRTVVQNGRATGVTVTVAFDHPRTRRRVSPWAAKAEGKASARISACADHAVRALTWPPNRRRDSFTTTF